MSLIPFQFEGASVRVVMVDGEPWFVAADVCAVLEIVNTARALGRLDDDEKGVHKMNTLGGDQQMSVVSESGLYALIFTSRKPAAKRFRKWVTAEVLPTIRQTGRYAMRPTVMASRALRGVDPREVVRAVNVRATTLAREDYERYRAALLDLAWRLRLPPDDIATLRASDLFTGEAPSAASAGAALCAALEGAGHEVEWLLACHAYDPAVLAFDTRLEAGLETIAAALARARALVVSHG